MFFTVAAVSLFESFPRPENCTLCAGVEPFGIEQGTLVVIAQQASGTFHGPVNALARVGAVADNIAQTVDFLNPLPTNVGQRRLKPFEVSVNIANDGSQRKIAPQIRVKQQ